MTGEKMELFQGGVDIGNKNYKVSMNDKKFEFPIAYTKIDEYYYKNETTGDGTKKVKFNDNYYLVGLECNGILPKNKGDHSFREVANMIKLTGLAEFLGQKNLSSGKFKLVTGTPLSDFDGYKKDYKDFLIDEEVQTIEVNGQTYNIQVTHAFISKQCAAVAPTISGWKEKEHLILIDLGGGTADIAYFRRGTVVRYITIDFPLNKIMEDLGNYLNGLGLGLMRPDETNSGFLHTMEKVIKEGNYLNVTSLNTEGISMNLSEIINKWLQSKVNNLIESIALRLDLSEAVRNAAEVYYFAGGSLLLRRELSENQTFRNKTVLDEPEFANVKAFDTLAQVREWDNEATE